MLSIWTSLKYCRFAQYSFQATDCFPTHAHAKDLETVDNVERGKKLSERLRA